MTVKVESHELAWLEFWRFVTLRQLGGRENPCKRTCFIVGVGSQSPKYLNKITMLDI
jgi:hypothetical protein